MLPTFSFFIPKDHFRQVRSFLNQFSFYKPKIGFSVEASLENLPNSPSSRIYQSHKKSSSSDFYGIAESIISKSSHFSGSDNGEAFTNCTLKDYFLRLSDISPVTVRRFWRTIDLKPQDVFEILVGFEPSSGNYETEVKKVKSLWGMFKWASEKNGGFEHFPQSCKIMASMLVRAGLFVEVETVLSRSESRGILLDCQEIFSDLIEGYVGELELERAICTYDRMRRLSLVPTSSSYQALLKYLIGLNETRLMYNVYVDMSQIGIRGSSEEINIHENVVRLLCIDGRIQEARELVRKVMASGILPGRTIIHAICCGYCEKKDFDDILSFFSEMRIAPDVIVGNKILFSLGKDYGVQQASLFMEKMEELGFCPDERTFGILIGYSCRERNLEYAFIYLSGIISRSLKPHVYSYNALLSGFLTNGMWTHSRNILLEMKDMGVTPNLSTFRVLLAGFCKAMRFDEVKAVIDEMADRGFIKLSSTEDPLTEAFQLLGFNPLDVKIRRDNDKGFFKTEFYDNLGNGLYLDTDVDKYEKVINKVLEDAMIPDFNSSFLEYCRNRDIKNTFSMVDEMARWGQKLSLPASLSLLGGLPRSAFGVKTINHLLESMFKSVYHLDQQYLNKIVQMYSKKGLTFSARHLFDGMVRRNLTIENGTYSALLLAFCKKSDLKSLRYCHHLARKYNWSAKLEDRKVLLSHLCQKKWLNEAFEMFETMLLASPCNASETFHSFLEELCSQGFTSAALIFLQEFPTHAIVLDSVAYSHLIRGFCKEEKFSEASTILSVMLSKNLTPALDVSIQLIPRLWRTDMEKASALKDICLTEQPSVALTTLCALIKRICRLKMVEEATNLFKETLSMGLMPDVETFNILIQGYCRENKSRKVVEVLGVLIRKSLRITISSYSHLVLWLCTERMFHQAWSLKELLHKESDLSDIIIYNILIFHFSSRKNILFLDALIHELEKEGLRYDEVTYNFLIQGLVQCQRISGSVGYLMTMIGQDLRPSTRSVRDIISYFCRKNEVEKALDISRELELRGWIHGTVIQNRIVQALLKKNKIHEAVDFLDRMESKELIHDNINYDLSIKQLCLHGRQDKAVDLLNLMLRKGRVPESSSYDCIIQSFCSGHKLDSALDFHAEMLCRNRKPSKITWETLVCGLCQDGRVAEAEQLLNSMIQLGETPSKEMFCSVINKHRFENNVRKASELLKVMQEIGYVPDFDTHWSLISNLGSSNKKDRVNPKHGFLSGLLSGFGFDRKNHNDKDR
ncbi:pentatricopeptide repeat-containing protein [Dorcoceras hygrometricum]|uniref:Pentatricopeptide repeat-containing protein n=1 Tax=Dorcoceras hygrometricum TaxID=472368 RepID=A0A2Z7BF94_9LAMI|nr:pentatricopeptide repeat-containing protein [Dorcoceras hygrometricum]